MGLDMYLVGDDFVPTGTGQNREKRGDFEVQSYRVRMGYWRKFAPLHCYIIENYAHGEDDCSEIQLESSDLLEIARALKENALPENDDCHGCFFGDPQWWSEMREQAEQHAAVFEKAAEWLEQGVSSQTWRSVHYAASW